MRRSLPARPRLACLLLTLLLGGCGAGAGRRSAPGAYAQSLDSESNTCLRNPRLCQELAIGQPSGTATRQRLAELGASVYAAAEGVRILDEALIREINQLMIDCAKEAEFQVNERHFGGNPTPKQCHEVVERDARGNPITRAMLLGQEKHQAALACVQEKLTALRPGGFGLNQRYRFNEGARRWEPLSSTQESALRRAGGEGLVGTLVPDVIIHTGSPLEVLDVYDFKFPCPGSNPAAWRQYPVGHPHHPSHQGEMYYRAFGGNPARVSPRWGVKRLRDS